jgi:hypothetical protein
MNNIISLLMLMVIGFTACKQQGASEKLEDCPYGKPVAVFSSGMKGVTSHQFTPTPYDASEQFVLDDTIAVTLLQSGCEKPIQEFRFEFSPDAYEKSAFSPAEIAVSLLNRLGSLDPSTAALSAWAQAIAAMPSDWILAEPREIQPGTSVKLDWISADGLQTLILVLGAS